LRLVSQQANRRACIRAAKVENDPTIALADATAGSPPRRRRSALHSGGKCTGSELIQRGAVIGNAAHRGAVTDLVHDLFETR
jgi:hypothetical protein